MSVAKVDKVDIKRTTKGRQKRTANCCLYIRVFLDTKKEKEWLIIYLYSLL
jgi:hypothetical protein